MDLDLTSALLVYGPLGVITIVCLLVIKSLYNDNRAERKENAEEMRKLEEKYVAKADFWVNEYHEQAEATRVLLDKLISRIDTRKGEG